MSDMYTRFQQSEQVIRLDGEFPIVEIPEITPEKTVPQIIIGARKALNDSRLHILARALCRELVDQKIDPALAKWCEVQAVCNLVRAKIRYTADPQNIELMFYADTIMNLWSEFGSWAEDCDSSTGMVLALLWSLGHTCSVTLIGFDAHVDGFDHVVVESKLPDPLGWRIADPTEPSATHVAREAAFYKRFLADPQ